MKRKLNMDKPIVGFDMDGVILDNYDTKIRIAKTLGFEIKLHHSPSAILKTMIPQLIYEELQKILYDNTKVAMSVPLMRGVKGILTDLRKKKIPYFLISRREMPSVAIRILKRHKLWPEHFNDSNSFFVKEPKDKNTQAAKLGITHYIDDELKIINVLKNVPNRFLFDPFNSFEKAKHYTRIRSWSEFKEHVDLI